MTDRSVVSHVLRRLTFGPTGTEVDAAVRAGVEPTVARLLASPAVPALPDLGADPVGALGKNATKEQKQDARRQMQDQAAAATWWWVDRLATTGGTAGEKLVFFWHGHWATSVQKVRSANLMLGQQQTFRRYGTGPTGPLVRAMLRDPALIVWLDGQRNTRKAPNENLAREVMELFTLGVGHYSEDDVKAAAKVLTGWQIDRAAGTARLAPARHDTRPVALLGHTGPLDVDGFADLLTRNPAHVPFLAARIWARYGSDDPAPPEMAAALAAAGNDAPAMLRALATHESFSDTAGHLVKQPIDWVVGALRQLGIDTTKLTTDQRKQVLGALHGLGQVPFRPPSVGGWPAGPAWLTTASTQARLRFGQQFAGLAPAAVNKLDAVRAADRLDACAAMLAVDAWSERTAAVLRPAAAEPRKLLSVALATPEYTVH